MADHEMPSEDVSKEDLLIYIKEKTKELKATQRKLTKLEERYLTVFKETKQVKKSIEQFYVFFGDFLTRFAISAPVEENDKVAKFEAVAEQLVVQFNRLAESAKAAEIQLNEKTEDIKTQIQKTFQGEIAHLKQELFTKDDRLKQLEKKLDEHERLNFDNLLNELKNVSTSSKGEIEEKIRESDRTTEILTLKQEIRELKEKLMSKKQKHPENGKLPEERTLSEERDTRLSVNSAEKTPTADSASQTDSYLLLSLESRIATENGHGQLHKTSDLTASSSKSDSEIRFYIKDLLLKYFYCEKKRQTEEKVQILNVLHDVLKFDYEDRMETTKIARERGRLFNFI